MNRLDDPPGLMKGRKPSFIGMNGAPETDDQQRIRFQIELEFVQCLANPNYLNFLAQRGYFKEVSFINYLKYLLYWKEPEYAKYLKYPMCLYFLDLLQYEHFRREVVNSQCTKFIDDQQILLWQHYTRRRTRLLQTAAEQTQHTNPQNNGIAQPKHGDRGGYGDGQLQNSPVRNHIAEHREQHEADRPGDLHDQRDEGTRSRRE